MTKPLVELTQYNRTFVVELPVGPNRMDTDFEIEAVKFNIYHDQITFYRIYEGYPMKWGKSFEDFAVLPFPPGSKVYEKGSLKRS